MTDSVTVQASASGDTYIFSLTSGTNNGTVTTLFIKSGATVSVGLVRFDLSSIPGNATVTSAKVLLTGATGSSVNSQFHRMLRPWTELGATWISYDGTHNWATSGASDPAIDYDNTLLATFGWPGVDTQVEIPIPVSIVQSWVNGSSPNNGFRLTPFSSTSIRYHSREAVTPAFRPLLEVSYTTPIVYEINSIAINAGIQATWPPIVTGQNADATQKINTTWYEHLWRCEFMEMADWQIIEPLKGSAFTELKTTGQVTPNTGDTFATGKIMDATGQQAGRRMINVNVRFLVDVTS